MRNLFQFIIQVGSLLKPFPIPKFRDGTEKNLEKELLIDTDRKYIVQTLATMLMVHVQRPTLSECGVVAKELIAKYGFLKDEEGEGEVIQDLHPCMYFVLVTSYLV